MNKTIGAILLIATTIAILGVISDSSDADIGDTFTDGILTYEITDAINHNVRVYTIIDPSLTVLEIPNTVIHEGTEYNVTSLSGLNAINTRNIVSMHIPSNVIELYPSEGKAEDYIPGNFPVLRTVTVSPDNPMFATKDGVLFDKDMKSLLIYPSGHGRSSYTIPSTVTYVVRGAFAYADGLEELKVEEGNTKYRTDTNGLLYDADMTTLFAYPNGKVGASPRIPDTVKRIDMYAFANSSITDVTIPDGVTDFGNYVFSGCSSLKVVTLGKSVDKIDSGFFKDCLSLERIVIKSDKDRIEIEDHAFEGCNPSVRFESGRGGYDVAAFYDQEFSEEYDFGLNESDLTVYLKWTEVETSDNTPMIVGFTIGIVGLIALLSYMYFRKLF